MSDFFRMEVLKYLERQRYGATRYGESTALFGTTKARRYSIRQNTVLYGKGTALFGTAKARRCPERQNTALWKSNSLLVSAHALTWLTNAHFKLKWRLERILANTPQTTCTFPAHIPGSTALLALQLGAYVTAATDILDDAS